MNEKSIVLQAAGISRGYRQSIAASVAYITGQKFLDIYTGRTYDYSYREDVLYWEQIFTMPVECQEFLNLLNQAEKRKDALMAHKYVMALPNELTVDEWITVIEDFLDENFIQLGYPAVFAIHSGIASEHPKPTRLNPIYAREDNPHVHIIVPFRKADEHGFEPTKIEGRSTYDKLFLKLLRISWAKHLNQARERLGLEVRFDHRSYKDRGLDRIPTPHIGPKAMALEMRGIETDIGDHYLATIARDVEQERQLIYDFDREKKLEIELNRY